MDDLDKTNVRLVTYTDLVISDNIQAIRTGAVGTYTVCTIDSRVRFVPGRSMGNTTRQVDFAIEMLFQGHRVYVVDHAHYKNSECSRMLMERIIDRLRREHKVSDIGTYDNVGSMHILDQNYNVIRHAKYTFPRLHVDKRQRVLTLLFAEKDTYRLRLVDSKDTFRPGMRFSTFRVESDSNMDKIKVGSVLAKNGYGIRVMTKVVYKKIGINEIWQFDGLYMTDTAYGYIPPQYFDEKGDNYWNLLIN